MVPKVVNLLLLYIHKQMKCVSLETLLCILSSYYSNEAIEKTKIFYLITFLKNLDQKT